MSQLLSFFSLIVILAAFNMGLLAQESSNTRHIQNINKNWEYLEENAENLNVIESREGWQAIDLPHSWNQWDATDYLPGYRRDASWYRKKLMIPELNDRRAILYFEGANITTEVYVNQQLAGKHIGGYVGFEIDITPYITEGTYNNISVRVDNGFNPDVIPSQTSDFFIYGGITRDVWLKMVPANCIEKLRISTPEVSKTSASTSLEMDLKYYGNPAAEGQIHCEIVDREDRVILKQSFPFKVKTGGQTLEASMPNLANPYLWSPDNPNLYEAKVSLELDGKKVDELSERIGYRWYDFEPNGPFLLNGERLLIRGTHRHEEHAGYGAAMPNELHRKDIEMIKEMGANFVRLGHYPQDPEVYKACDELGIMVWDELPWCRGGVGEEHWQVQTKQLLKEQILQNYNHPSIFFWSMGNEVYWLPYFPEGDHTERLNTFLKELNDISHDLDPYRYTAIRKYYEGAELVDVFSPSIWSGWYAGVYKNYEQALAKQRSKYKRLLHMEYGGSSHVGRHTETPIDGDGLVNPDEWTEAINQVNVKNVAKSGDWSENYIVDLFDWHLHVSENLDWFPGNAQWAFKDFGTPLRPENPIPFVNQKGLVDRAGKPKDAYYVFKSYWAKEPFTYIESHTWTERMGPKDKPRTIHVFSNCDEVELSFNQQSMGRRKRDIKAYPAMGLHWDLNFKAGKNTLMAKGYKDGQLVCADTLSINYSFEKHGSADKIAFTIEALANGNYLAIATMNDKNGNRVLDYEEPLYFSHDGSGEMLINYGTPTRSQVVQMANGRAAIEIKPGKGKAFLEARNQEMKRGFFIIDFDHLMKQENKTGEKSSPTNKK